MPKITGAKAYAARLRSIAGSGKEGPLGRALYAAGQLIELEAERLITAGSVSGKNHVPSKPGEPPNRDSGVLDNSIETVLVEPLKAEISANAPYSAALEFGTSKMAARPFMSPAVQHKRKEVIDLMRRAAKTIVDDAGGVRGDQ